MQRRRGGTKRGGWGAARQHREDVPERSRETWRRGAHGKMKARGGRGRGAARESSRTNVARPSPLRLRPAAACQARPGGFRTSAPAPPHADAHLADCTKKKWCPDSPQTRPHSKHPAIPPYTRGARRLDTEGGSPPVAPAAAATREAIQRAVGLGQRIKFQINRDAITNAKTPEAGRKCPRKCPPSDPPGP